MNIRLLFWFFVLGFSLNVFSQDEESCFKVNDFSVEERNQNYPYNKTSRIAFVSFKDDYKKLDEDEKEGIFKTHERNGEMVEVYAIGEVMQKYFDILKEDFSRYNPKDFEESIDLDESQKNELTDLIFNFGNNNEKVLFSIANCYMPRNAILFFDENDKLFGFIEICFECNNYRTSDNKIDLNYDCGEKLILLQNLFEKVGIKYGVERDD